MNEAGPDHRGATRENALFARFRDEKDARALAELFDTVAPSLLRLARHVASGEAAAEDLVQETFLTAIENPHAWRGDGSVFAWLVGVQGNLARAARRRAARPTPPASGRDDVAADPQQLAEHAELRSELARLIATLPEPLVPVLKLHLDHQLSAKEIADALQRPAGTVRTQIVRGLELLRKLLPAGLAVGVLVSLPGRGIDAVRDAVVGAAEKAAGAAPALVGAAFAKATIVACALLVLGGGTAWLALRGDQADAERAKERGERTASGAGAGASPPEPATSRPEGEAARMPVAGTTPPGALVTTPLPATAAGTLRVTVKGVDAASGASPAVRLEGVVVQAWQPAERETPPEDVLAHLRTGTTSGGQVVLHGLEPGAARLVVYPDPSGRTFQATRIVRIQANVESTATIELTTAGEVSGRVVDERGQGIARAATLLLVNGERIYGSTRRARTTRRAGETDDEGRFRIPRLACETRVAALARAHHAPSLAYTIEPDDPARPLVVTMPSETGTIEVEVRDGRGRPAHLLDLFVEDPLWFSRDLGSGRRVEPFPPLWFSVGADGKERLTGVPVQDLVIRPEARIERSRHALPARVTTRVGATTRARLSIHAGAGVHGVVLDADELPVAGALVECRTRARTFAARTTTDAAGAFAFGDLPSDRLLVTASKEGRTLASSEIPAVDGVDSALELRVR